jgi:glycosyltransferase involved in cell wall biosynthesis
VYVPQAADHWPRSFLVALHAQKPVMTTSDSGAPCELLRDGHSGLIVEPMAPALADAMTDIARDAARAGRLGAAGHRSLVEHDITWERAARALVG